jgi:hypothetical protein
LDEIGLMVYEEMSFKVKVYGRTPDEKRSQKLTMSLCDRRAKNLKLNIAMYEGFRQMVHYENKQTLLPS